MKKIIIFIVVLIATISTVNGYEYKGREIKVDIPENIEYLEYCNMTNNCFVPIKFKKLIYLNTLLIKRGYNSIW